MAAWRIRQKDSRPIGTFIFEYKSLGISFSKFHPRTSIDNLQMHFKISMSSHSNHPRTRKSPIAPCHQPPNLPLKLRKWWMRTYLALLLEMTRKILNLGKILRDALIVLASRLSISARSPAKRRHLLRREREDIGRAA
jgi:hypothetical protein